MSDTTFSTDLVAAAAERAAHRLTAAERAVPARRRSRDERGMTTAEYAVGTIAAVSFAGVLIKILTDPEIQSLILRLIMAVLNHFMQTPSI